VAEFHSNAVDCSVAAKNLVGIAWEEFVGSVPVGLFQADRAGNCIYVNQAWSNIAGMSQDQALGLGWLEAIATAQGLRKPGQLA
jgi:PAS domain S-box-containing protein